ncbi:DUF1538 domain-containing protein [Eubacteriales bacterium OttesenSCG-928-A19]|nr:DUF1538 domain-containing protein [Eubacteriales bacterium OttesenSCG-928-A19]
MKLVRVLKETFIASSPLAAIIIIVCGFVAPMQSAGDYVKLFIGYAGVVVGQALFLVGLDISILPIGKSVGESLDKLGKTILVVLCGVLFGLVVTVAEPSLAVLARQTNMIMPVISETAFIWVTAAGLGLFVGVALYRIMRNISIKAMFTVFYIAIFATVIFVPEQFVALAFDGSGATTGDISVPFLLTLGIGASATMSKHKSNDDTFGIIGVASAGPILAVFIYGIILNALHGGTLPPAEAYTPGAAESYLGVIHENLGTVALALFPVVILFLPFQARWIKLPRRELARILLGTIPVFVGLLIFLSSIDFGFAFAGKYIGETFLDVTRPGWFRWLLLPVGFVLGGAIAFSEPAVTVLSEQLEELTNGHIKRMTIRLTLAIGIGAASVLALLKILTGVNILWFLTPLYVIAITMMRFTPTMFVGLAFDSGGVSGGALTSAFLTPLALGVAQAAALQSGSATSILTNGFGMIAFVSVTPLVAVQALGIIFEVRSRKLQRIVDEETLEDIEALEDIDALEDIEMLEDVEAIEEIRALDLHPGEDNNHETNPEDKISEP